MNSWKIFYNFIRENFLEKPSYIWTKAGSIENNDGNLSLTCNPPSVCVEASLVMGLSFGLRWSNWCGDVFDLLLVSYFISLTFSWSLLSTLLLVHSLLPSVKSPLLLRSSVSPTSAKKLISIKPLLDPSVELSSTNAM